VAAFGDPAVTTPAERSRREAASLRWVGWLLMCLWCGSAVLYGGFGLVERSVEAHNLTANAPWTNPTPPEVGAALWLLWLLATFNLAPAALVVGLIAVTRERASRLRRALLLTALVVGGAVAELTADSLTRDNADPGQDFVHDGRLSSVIVVAAAVILAASTYGVLAPRRRTRADTASAATG
jgi:hypothetical protein